MCKFFSHCSTREIKPGQTDIGRKVTSRRPIQTYRTTTPQSGTPNNTLASLNKSNNHSVHHRPSGAGGLQQQPVSNISNNPYSSQLPSLSNSTSLQLGNEIKSNTSYISINNSSSKNEDDERGSGIGGGGGGFSNSNSSSTSYYNNLDSHSTLNSQYASTIPTSNLLNHRYNEDLIHNSSNHNSGNNNRNGGPVHHKNPDIAKRSIK